MTEQQFQAGVSQQEEALRRKGRLRSLAEEVHELKAKVRYWREEATRCNNHANDYAERLRKTELEMLDLAGGMD